MQHINPNCKNPYKCKPHGETGEVKYVKTYVDSVISKKQSEESQTGFTALGFNIFISQQTK